MLTSVARHFDIDLNVLAGSVETLGGQQFGHLRVQLATTPTTTPSWGTSATAASARNWRTPPTRSDESEFASDTADFAAETGDSK